MESINEQSYFDFFRKYNDKDIEFFTAAFAYWEEYYELNINSSDINVEFNNSTIEEYILRIFEECDLTMWEIVQYRYELNGYYNSKFIMQLDMFMYITLALKFNKFLDGDIQNFIVFDILKKNKIIKIE